jgi:cation diffusion facilitator CzcD-associated flavoprotein CzcO
MTSKPFNVAVIGAGMSGLYMAKRLAEAGFAFTVYEKADEVGGTWRQNDYPGLFVDIPVSAYQLSFAPKYDWSRAYAPGPEIQRYLVQVADEHELRQHIVFGTEFVQTTWTGSQWELRSADGRIFTADAVVSATGFLHVPTLPAIPGIDSFKGEHFHSSRWPKGLDVTGKRVGVIGSGSSGIQIVSALAYLDCEVVQIVRTPQWIEVVDNPEITAELLERATLEPQQGKAVLAELERGINQDPRLQDPHWKLEPGPVRENAMQALREDLLIITDPELREKLTPDFPPGCKRIPKSPWYYTAVQEPSVTVVRGGVERIEPTGAVTDDETLHEFDIIVFATGFAGHAYMRPMQVLGLNGGRLDDVWADGPYSYRGVSVPGFPNFFLLHGPFSPVNNVPVPKTLDDEIGYICRVLAYVSAAGIATAPTEAATERFRARLDEALPNTVWYSGCDNWYKGHGRTPLIWPWYDTEHEQLFKDLALDDLEIVECGAGRPHVPIES